MLKTDALAARGLEGIMWEACLTVLTVLPSASVCRVYSLRTLRAPAQFFATNRARKLKQDLQNIYVHPVGVEPVPTRSGPQVTNPGYPRISQLIYFYP